MTKIITRLMVSEAEARSAAERLMFKGVPRNAVDVIAKGDDVKGALTAARVDDSAVAPYAKAIAAGSAAIVVRATYKPLGVAQMTRDFLADRETVAAPAGVVEEHQVWDAPQKASSVLTTHPHMLSLPVSIIGGPSHGPVTGGLGMNMLRPRREKRSVMDSGRRMSRMFWPMPLLSTKERRSKVMSGGRHMSRMFWPMPLISRKPRRKSVIPGGDFQLSRVLRWPTVS